MNVKGLILCGVVAAHVLWTPACSAAPCEYWPTNGWRSSAPQDQGMEAAILKKMSNYLERELPKLNSLIVVRHGYIVFERYLQEGSEKELRNLYSATKSVTSILTGIAIQEGHLKGLDQKVLDFFPEYAGHDLSPAASKVVIRHLLTMSDGLALDWTENSYSEQTFRRAARSQPGASWFYSGLSPQLLSSLITRAVGEKALEFGKKRLFGPLGIKTVRWDDNRSLDTGDTLGPAGLFLCSRDLAKIGYLMLNKGMWEGRQIVPAAWVEESTKAQIDIGDPASGFAYGFLWWVHSVSGYGVFSAEGLGGQWLTVIPDLDLVVVITTSDEDDARTMDYFAVVGKFLLPAVRG